MRGDIQFLSNPQSLADKAKQLRVDVCEFGDFDPVLMQELWNLLARVERDYRGAA